MARMRSRVAGLPRPGSLSARDTVDAATPACLATSLIVTGRGAVTSPGNHTRTGHGNRWQTIAKLGRRPADQPGWGLSTARPVAQSSSSPRRGPTSCRLTGEAEPGDGTGIARAGTPARLTGAV